jgi:ERCC4-type nuclease
MEVIIDFRENAIINLYNDDHVFSENLPIGDIHIRKFEDGKYNNIVILERKTILDLQSSLRDGRFSEQKRRILCSDFKNKGYIIEGHIPTHDEKFEDILRQLIIRIQFKDKMSIFITKSIQDTVSLLREIYRKVDKDPKLYNNIPDTNYVETLHVCKKDNLTPQRCFILQLSQIPSISKATAQIIAQNYPNWNLLIDALKEKETFIEKNKLAKIGNKRFEQLQKYILLNQY